MQNLSPNCIYTHFFYSHFFLPLPLSPEYAWCLFPLNGSPSAFQTIIKLLEWQTRPSKIRSCLLCQLYLFSCLYSSKHPQLLRIPFSIVLHMHSSLYRMARHPHQLILLNIELEHRSSWFSQLPLHWDSIVLWAYLSKSPCHCHTFFKISKRFSFPHEQQCCQDTPNISLMFTTDKSYLIITSWMKESMLLPKLSILRSYYLQKGNTETKEGKVNFSFPTALDFFFNKTIRINLLGWLKWNFYLQNE